MHNNDLGVQLHKELRCPSISDKADISTLMPETVKRTLRITTKQHILADVPPVQEGFPMRQWSIEISALNQDGEEVPAAFLDRVTYKLHPTFTNPTRVVKKPPFFIEEQGWGEFDLQIVLHTAERGGDHSFSHDLNFLSPEYTAEHTFSFPTNKPGLNALLEQSGPVPPPASSKRQGEELEKKPKKPRVAEKGSIDLEKLAGGLEKLNQEHLLSVVQMVTDNKTSDMYIKNDPLGGEFHMDLYTLPDPLLKSLWEYVKKNAEQG